MDRDAASYSAAKAPMSPPRTDHNRMLPGGAEIARSKPIVMRLSPRLSTTQAPGAGANRSILGAPGVPSPGPPPPPKASPSVRLEKSPG